jgi:hypothetical protein
MDDNGVFHSRSQQRHGQQQPSSNSTRSLVSRSRTHAQQQCLTWSRVPVYGSVIPPPRSGAASVVVNGRLYCFGGYGGADGASGTGGRLDDFYSFCFASQTWEIVQVRSQDRPAARENNGVVIRYSVQYSYDEMTVACIHGIKSTHHNFIRLNPFRFTRHVNH